jgi:hypothetical protein
MHLDDETGWTASAATYNCRTKLPGEYAGNLIKLQTHVIKLRKQQMHMLGHIGNADDHWYI